MARQEAISNYAAARARLLLGCYRTGDANDPETYVAALTAILARYPEEVITAVTHPATGLPSMKSWLPTVKEVTDACNDAVEPIVQKQARQKRIAEQIEARAIADEEDRRRPSLEELKAKYGPDWGLSSGPDKKPESNFTAPTADQLRHHYQHYDLSRRPKTMASGG